MKRFSFLNTIFGWVAFFIAAVTYLLTIEPTASFWDCGAFITSAYNLELTHPPGAPFYMLTGRLFTLFASDPTYVAMMVNALSGILSALTILFLFWTITHLARKIIVKSEEDFTIANIIAILGSGMVGALAFTWSITFWFSAVEAEVYAYSSLFTAVVFWLILKWESQADQKGSDRWLILIAYLMGLSIGVHLLNLLTIPVLVLVYYFKKYEPTTKGLITALATSVVILAFVLYGFIFGLVEVASWFELLFVNTFGFAFNTGLKVYVALLIGVLIWSIYETYTAKNRVRMLISFVVAVSLVGIPFLGASVGIGIFIILAMIGFFYWKRKTIQSRWLYTIVTMVTVMCIGFSSYTAILIRSSANPPLDQSSPDNIFALRSYLNREQYGETPLFRGAVFNAQPRWRVEGNMCVMEFTEGRAIWAQAPRLTPECPDRYIIVGHRTRAQMAPEFYMFFPRMWNAPNLTEAHINAYQQWGRITGRRITFDQCGRRESQIIPTFTENMRFFFSYQIGFMYWRYFMWNFSGRQNDIQGHGEIEHGNWITGFRFIDNRLVGCQLTLPTEMLENRGRNRYFMMPLFLGILGILFLLFNAGRTGKQHFWLIFTMFIMTGIAIVVYLNQIPFQPRERDYAYAGSFYAFAIWIGLGVLGLIRTAEKYIPKSLAAAIITVICLGVPIQMATQNWDDSDRSGRFTARDFGHNYLVSVGPNAILFSNGDNDTFPLWYNQKVEGVRRDVRVTNLSYMQTDWYILQIQRGAWDSAPLPISWTHDQFITGTNDIVRVREMTDQALSVDQVFEFILSNDPRTKDERGESFIPTRRIFIPVDADQVIATGTLPESRRHEIVDRIYFDLGTHLTRNELMVIEMINQNRWERPMYFAVTIGHINSPLFLGLGTQGHFELTGMAYQIVPVRSESGVNVEKMYYNMMNRFRFGNANDPRVYLCEVTRRMIATHRMMFFHLAEALLQTGDSVRTRNVLDYAFEVLPGKTVRYDQFAMMLASLYYELGEFESGDRILDDFANNAIEHLTWYFNLRPQHRRNSARQISMRFSDLHHSVRLFHQFGREELFEQYFPIWQEFEQRLN